MGCNNHIVVDVEPYDIIQWQHHLSESQKLVKKTVKSKNGKEKVVETQEYYSDTYLRTINNQLVAIFNYAATIRRLPISPCKGLEKIGAKDAPEREIWEPEEFAKFIRTQEHNPYISMCVFNGIPYTTISTQVGHSEFLQSLHYSHSYKNSGDFLVNALEQVKGGVANV